MLSGATLAMVFTSKDVTKYDIHGLEERLLSKTGLFTFFINVGLMILTYIISFKIIKDIMKIWVHLSNEQAALWMLKRDHIKKCAIVDKQGMDETSEEFRVRNLQAAKEQCFFKSPRWLKFAVFCLPWFAGFMSGMLALTAKWTLNLVVHMDRDNAGHVLTYVIFALTFMFLILQLTTQNLSLKYFDVSYVIPVFQASVVFHNTMCGGILLQEFFNYKPLNIVMFSVGIFIWIIGILVLIIPKQKQAANSESDSSYYIQEPLMMAQQSSVNETLLKDEEGDGV